MVETIFTPAHLLLVLVVALIVVGPKRLPDVGRGLGQAIRGFRQSLASPEGRDEPPAPHR